MTVMRITIHFTIFFLSLWVLQYELKKITFDLMIYTKQTSNQALLLNSLGIQSKTEWHRDWTLKRTVQGPELCQERGRERREQVRILRRIKFSLGEASYLSLKQDLNEHSMQTTIRTEMHTPTHWSPCPHLLVSVADRIVPVPNL